MGQGGSKEIVVSGAPPSTTSQPIAPPSNSAQVAAEFRDAEEAIFREGYQRGFAEALTKADEGVERQTRAAFALAALDDEIERKKSLEGDLARLQSSRYKAPLRALQCQKEELELSACDVDARSTDCRRAISSYAACADRLVQDIMLPLAKSQLK